MKQENDGLIPSLEEARAIWKTLPKNNTKELSLAEQFAKDCLLHNFTEEALEKNKEVENLFQEFLVEHNLTHKLPFSYKEAEEDDSKAGDNAFSMLQLIVKTVNKNIPKTSKYWTPYFNNDGFCYGTFEWHHSGVYYFDVCFRLQYNSKEVCEATVKKYEAIYKVYNGK